MLLKMLLYNSEVERMGQGTEQGSATNERTVRGGQWISDGRGIKQKLGNSSPNRSMVHIDRRTRDKSPTPNTPESMRARYHRDHHHHFLRAPLSTPLLRSTVTLLRAAAALVGVCVILTGAMSMPLKRGGVVLSGTIRSVDMLPKELVVSMRRLLALRRAHRFWRRLVIALIGSGSGSAQAQAASKAIRRAFGARARAWAHGIRRGGGGITGGRDVRRDGPMRKRSRIQVPSHLGEQDRGTDSSVVNRGRNALAAL